MNDPSLYGLVQTKHLATQIAGTTFGILSKDLEKARPSKYHRVMFITEHATYWHVTWIDGRYGDAERRLSS